MQDVNTRRVEHLVHDTFQRCQEQRRILAALEAELRKELVISANTTKELQGVTNKISAYNISVAHTTSSTLPQLSNKLSAARTSSIAAQTKLPLLCDHINSAKSSYEIGRERALSLYVILKSHSAKWYIKLARILLGRSRPDRHTLVMTISHIGGTLIAALFVYALFKRISSWVGWSVLWGFVEGRLRTSRAAQLTGLQA